MCLAAVALRFAFPHQPYMFRENYISESSNNSAPGSSTTTTATTGRVVTMQTISHNLKETMNPKDIMHGKFPFPIPLMVLCILHSRCNT